MRLLSSTASNSEHDDVDPRDLAGAGGQLRHGLDVAELVRGSALCRLLAVGRAHGSGCRRRLASRGGRGGEIRAEVWWGGVRQRRLPLESLFYKTAMAGRSLLLLAPVLPAESFVLTLFFRHEMIENNNARALNGSTHCISLVSTSVQDP